METMKGLTNYITERPWSDIITEWYVRVDDTYQALVTQRGTPFRLSGPEPELADSEVITISLVIETFWLMYRTSANMVNYRHGLSNRRFT
jgi:hypothetical protein